MDNTTYENCILVTDLDGTLLKPLSYDTNETIVSKDNREFLAEFIRGRGKVVLWSGHSIGVCDKIVAELARYMQVNASDLPVSIIGRNGSVAKVRNSIVHNITIKPSVVSKVEGVVRRKDKEWKAKGIDEVSAFSVGGHSTPFMGHHVSGGEAAFVKAEHVIAKIFGNTASRYNASDPKNAEAYINIVNDEEFKQASRLANEIVVFSTDKDKNVDIIKAILGECGDSVEMANSFELISKGQNKVNTLVELVKIIDPIAKSEVIIIGDGKRDISAITFEHAELRKRSKLGLGFAIRTIGEDGSVTNSDVIESVKPAHVVDFVYEIKPKINSALKAKYMAP